jgi:SAM-dependent methyltransferase
MSGERPHLHLEQFDAHAREYGAATALDPALLELGSDKRLRQRVFGAASFGHPAKLHLGLLAFLLARHTRAGETVADPMAGSGSILLAALWGRHVIARELEEQWLAYLERAAARVQGQGGMFEGELGEISVGQGDARLPWDYQADCVLFSPPYGNEASTTPTARRRLPYRLRQLSVPLDERWFKLAERPSAGAMGAVTFYYGRHPQQVGHLRGPRYWAAMAEVYGQARAALRPGGRLIVVVKDHIRGGRRIPTVEGTIALCEELGFVLAAHYRRRLAQLSLWQRRRKEARQPVVEEEDALVFQLAHARRQDIPEPVDIDLRDGRNHD